MVHGLVGKGNNMPSGKGTYGKRRGRPKKKNGRKRGKKTGMRHHGC